MIINYVKLTFKLLLRNPFFTFINVLGLSVDFAAFYISWPYAQPELKSDQFHRDMKTFNAEMAPSLDRQQPGLG